MDAVARLEANWAPRPGLYGFLGTVDHKRIGVRYLLTATAFLLIGGCEALVMRLQLARPESPIMGPVAYDRLFTMHGLTMIFWFASPILSGFGNYLIPLFIGARDMAFPRLNAFSYWTYLFSGIFLHAGVAGGQIPDSGWFAYAPNTERMHSPGFGMDFYALALTFLTVSTTVGAVNFIVTILRMRAPGMTLDRMPLAAWSTLTTSVVIVFSLPSLTAACILLELDRNWNACFFVPARGGDPILWQHLFWFFAHPWVYVVFMPATGLVSVMLPSLARRPIVGYRFVAAATVMTGVMSFCVWLHHMFAAGGERSTMAVFSAASMVISLFTAIQVFAWIATLWKGRPVMTPALRFVLGFIAALVVGGLNGIVTAFVPVDWQLTDTYFVVSHLHYVLVGANLFPVLAAFHHWLPKITGRLADERLARAGFWLSFVGFNFTFFPMQIAGIFGMPRRVYTYPVGMGWEGLNVLVTISAIVLAAGVGLTLGNLAWSARFGRAAGRDPWKADGLEWGIPSPPPPYAFAHVPTVATRNPLWDEHDEFADPGDERVWPGPGHLAPTTTWRRAELVALEHAPGDTVVPLVLAVVIFAVFAALLLHSTTLDALLLLATFGATAAWLRPRPDKKREEEARDARALAT